MATQIHGAGPTGQRSPGLDLAIAGYLAENPPAGTGGSGGTVTATDAPTAPAEGASASYLVTSAVAWPAGLVWSTDPDGGIEPYIEGAALVSMFTLDGVTRAVMGATYPGATTTTTTTAATTTTTTSEGETTTTTTTEATTTTTTTEATTTTTTTSGGGGGITVLQAKSAAYETVMASISIPTLTLDSPATAGTVLVASLVLDKANLGTLAAPSGWTGITPDLSNSGVSMILAYKVAAGGETTVTWQGSTGSVANGGPHVFAVHEFDGAAAPIDNAGLAQVAVSSITADPGASPAAGLAVAFGGVDSAGGIWDAAGPSWSAGYTQIFMLKAGAASSAPAHAIATKAVGSGDLTSCTLTALGSDEHALHVVVLGTA